MNYHIFFTTQYTDSCLQNCRFGATSVNPLANVKYKDVAFIFDGLRWKLYGPLIISSNMQYHDDSPIYGKNKRGIVNYPNRVSFDTDQVREISLNKLFALERNSSSKNYLLNRTIMSVIIANKQVHSTPLTYREGEYLYNALNNYGNTFELNSQYFEERQAVVDYVVANRKPKSEAIFEMLLIENRHNNALEELDKSKNILFNQFVLGIQRQVDILSISKDYISIVELKKKENKTNPYKQLKEYKDYVLTDYRLNEFRGKEVKLIAILEDGNKYLSTSIITDYMDVAVFRFNMMRDYTLNITEFA